MDRSRCTGCSPGVSTGTTSSARETDRLACYVRRHQLAFGATMPLPVPVVGATSHICLTPVLALLVGIRRIFGQPSFVLFPAGRIFCPRWLTTLGVNTLALGWVGPPVALGAWNLLRRLGTSTTFGLALACGLGGLSVYVADAMVPRLCVVRRCLHRPALSSAFFWGCSGSNSIGSSGGIGLCRNNSALGGASARPFCPILYGPTVNL